MIMRYRYADSVAGLQSIITSSLATIIAKIEAIEAKEDSEGVVYQNDIAILEYMSEVGKPLRWLPVDETTPSL